MQEARAKKVTTHDDELEGRLRSELVRLSCHVPNLDCPLCRADAKAVAPFVEQEISLAVAARTAAAAAKLREMSEQTLEGEDAPRRAALYNAATDIESLTPADDALALKRLELRARLDGAQNAPDHDEARCHNREPELGNCPRCAGAGEGGMMAEDEGVPDTGLAKACLLFLLLALAVTEAILLILGLR